MEYVGAHASNASAGALLPLRLGDRGAHASGDCGARRRCGHAANAAYSGRTSAAGGMLASGVSLRRSVPSRTLARGGAGAGANCHCGSLP